MSTVKSWLVLMILSLVITVTSTTHAVTLEIFDDATMWGDTVTIGYTVELDDMFTHVEEVGITLQTENERRYGQPIGLTCSSFISGETEYNFYTFDISKYQAFWMEGETYEYTIYANLTDAPSFWSTQFTQLRDSGLIPSTPAFQNPPPLPYSALD